MLKLLKQKVPTLLVEWIQMYHYEFAEAEYIEKHLEKHKT
jgi:hypothetical protein